MERAFKNPDFVTPVGANRPVPFYSTNDDFTKDVADLLNSFYEGGEKEFRKSLEIFNKHYNLDLKIPDNFLDFMEKMSSIDNGDSEEITLERFLQVWNQE